MGLREVYAELDKILDDIKSNKWDMRKRVIELIGLEEYLNRDISSEDKARLFAHEYLKKYGKNFVGLIDKANKHGRTKNGRR